MIRDRIASAIIGLLFIALASSLLVWATDPRTNFHVTKGSVQP